MSELYSQYQHALAWICVGVLIAGFHAFLLFKALPMLWDRLIVGIAGSTHPVKVAIVLAFVCPLCYIGMTKYAGHITYDGGISAGTTSNDVTNDLISIYWQRDPRRPVPLPLDSTVYIDYRPIGNTNDWGLLAQTTVGAWEWHGTLPNATNYDYNVWAYYIPPAPHTNGVWEWKTTYSRDGSKIVPFHARIEYEGKAIFGPDQKRKDNP